MGKRIGILTSGGDCPGLNMVIRTVVSHARLTYDWEVLGIPYATKGLLESKASTLSLHGLDLHGIDPLLSMGGTILGSTNKGDTLAQAKQLFAGYQALKLDALIAIGGDGSLAILRELANQGNWNLVAIPKTIDNDVAFTERSVGFDTAVNTVVDALNRLTYTAASHDRIMVVEVMGRTAGHLALQAGIAGGADVILIPEIPYSLPQVCQKLRELRDKWQRKFALIIVAEGAKTQTGEISCYTDSLGEVRLRGIGQYITEQIPACSEEGVETRLTILGHVQRGGMPSAWDRILAAAFGKAAIDLVAQKQFDRMVAWRNGEVGSVPLELVINDSPSLVTPNSALVQTARSLGIYVGQS
ncbi:MAG: ATP-dependent 6-phosphofructokinase [Xenococcaceae cyanobacterium MO_188.B19]|nr:ATP-dependent 6-phosphofructokinase [Xenococcaceae cyanobacterium MO_188.B19]